MKTYRNHYKTKKSHRCI